MNSGEQKKFNHMNLWDCKAGKLSLVKFIPTNGRDSSRHYLTQADVLRRGKSVRLACLVSTKKEICIDLALNSQLNLAGPPHCGFPVQSQSLLRRPGPSLDADNNRKEYLEHLG